MGLAEKRAIKEFADNTFPKIHEEIKAAAKFDVEIEIHWDTLAAENQSHRYNESLPAIYFQPLIDGLKEITHDDLGAEALKGALKKIEVKNVEGRGDTNWAKFENGVLELDKRYSNENRLQDRTNALKSTLEKAL